MKRAKNPAESMPSRRRASTAGLRKLLDMKRPSAAPMRSLLRGTMPVWGMGRPNGRRNSATTANQSAQAPTIEASAKARK